MSHNTPEPLGKELENGDPALGEELRQFFTDLLDGHNLERYHLSRSDYIDDYRIVTCNEEGRVETPLTSDAKELLRGGSLVEIERHILAIYSSSRAKPLFVVSPPY